MSWLTDEQAVRDILEIGRRMYAKGFAAGNDGNISARVGDDEIWATPSGVSKGFMTEDMLVKMKLDGTVLEGTRKPSSEVKMHLRLYREMPDCGGVVHAHPPVSAAFAAAGVPLDQAYLQESVVLLGEIPVAPYAMPGSSELADSVAPFCGKVNGLLLEHHGAVAWAADPIRAWYRLESIEYNATVAMYSRMMGFHRPLTEEQIDGLLTLRPAWGVTAGGRPKGRKE